MQCKKTLSILLFSITMLSSLNAGWSDRWMSIKNYFSGFVKKPSLSRKNLVVGGVGALAIAGAIAGAVWWYNRPASKNIKKEEKIIPKKDIKENPEPEDKTITSALLDPENQGHVIKNSSKEQEKLFTFKTIDRDSKPGDTVTLVDGGEHGLYSDYIGEIGKIEYIIEGKAEALVQLNNFLFQSMPMKIRLSYLFFCVGDLIGGYQKLLEHYNTGKASPKDGEHLKKYIMALLETFKNKNSLPASIKVLIPKWNDLLAVLSS